MKTGRKLTPEQKEALRIQKQAILDGIPVPEESPMKENCPECKVHHGHKAGCSLAANGTQHRQAKLKRVAEADIAFDKARAELEDALREGDYSLEAYHRFLGNKAAVTQDWGFVIEESEIHPWLKPHQKLGVMWGCRGGRRALFESFGLGKTVQQLEILRLILKRAGGRGLIVAPLGVRQEFAKDAARIDIDLKFVRSIEECEPDGIYLTNYETVRDGKLDPKHFTVASLDEAAILSSFGGTKTFREFMRLFESVPYRFVATATPDPNEYIELLAYAAFLGIMDVSQAKTRFFKRDSTKADKLTLHAHKEREFWLWVSSWALFLRKPSDLGPEYSDEGYDLPPFEVIYHEIPVEHEGAQPERDGQGRMFREAKHGVVDAAREKRDTLPARIAKAKEILASQPDEHFILWHDLEAERKEIERTIPTAVSVYGSQRSADPEALERAVMDFAEGRSQCIAAKPSMFGSGANWQYYCCRAIFCGIGFKFRDFVQALHRILRFLQPRPVQIHLIYASSEKLILQSLLEKWERHKVQTDRMAEIIQQYGLSQAAISTALSRGMGVERVEVSGPGYQLVNNDSVEEVHRMDANTVDFILTSIPFSTQYEYSPNYCYDEQTEVLTRTGWKYFNGISMEEALATVNLDTLQIEWQNPLRITWEPYCGPMLHFLNRRNFDLMVTPNHAMVVDSRVGNSRSGRRVKRFAKVMAGELERGFVVRKWRMLNTARPGIGSYPEFIEIPRCETSSKGPKVRHIERISPVDFMELAGWYLSEGYCDSLTSDHRGRIVLCQCSVNQPNRDAMEQLFRAIGITPRLEKRSVVGHNVHLAAFLLSQFGTGSYHKRIPRWVKDLHPELLKILRDTMMKGDGTKTGYSYTSFSRSLRDDFQEICILTGWRAAISGTRVGIGRSQVFPEVRTRPKTTHYSGMIGCATVPNGTLIVRRNGIPSVCGNSDFGHTDSNEHFFGQMDFLTPHLLRVLKPGRLASIHVKDRIVPGGITGLGFQTSYPFHAETIFHFIRHGFAYLGMKTIVTDVVRENNQTYRLGWSEQCKDGSKMGFGMPEYLLLFRKPPSDSTNSYADEPVIKSKAEYSRSRWQIDAHGFTRSNGNRPLMPQDLEGIPHSTIFKLFKRYSLDHVYDFEHHVALGEALEQKGILPVTFMLLQPQSWHPDVWTDVTRMRTLNGAQSAKGKEMHLCPMQFDIAEREIRQWTNEGETVLDPFGGLMTVPMTAVKLKRRGLGIELSSSYFVDGCYYVRAAEQKASTPTLFDLEEELEIETAESQA